MSDTQIKPPAGSTVVKGRVRVDEKPRRVAARLEPGEIAVIDQRDLDRTSAEALVEARPAAVLNAAPSATGRHPVQGPEILRKAGVLLLDDLGADLMRIREGDEVEIRGNEVWAGGILLAGYDTDEDTEAMLPSQHVSPEIVHAQVASFSASTEDYLAQEGPTVFEGVGVPKTRLSLSGRIVLLIADSSASRRQLRDLRAWIKDANPIVVAVEGGASYARKARLRPDVIVGDMDLVPEKLLRSGAQLVVRSGRDGVAPGQQRLDRMGLAHDIIEFSGSAEDAAILVAAFSHPLAIVTVGHNASLHDHLDRGRGAMAPAFFTRLSAQELLVPACVVAATHRPRIRAAGFAFLLIAALAATFAALWSTPWGHDLMASIASMITDLVGPNWFGTTTS